MEAGEKKKRKRNARLGARALDGKKNLPKTSVGASRAVGKQKPSLFVWHSQPQPGTKSVLLSFFFPSQ